MKGEKDTVQEGRPRCGWKAMPLRRLGLIATILAGLLLLLAVAPVACSESTEYRVLSFFFDGVPPPESGDERPSGRKDGDANGAPKPSKKPVPLSYHAPATDRRNCFEVCHSPGASMQAKAFGGETCRSCHADHFRFELSDWVHGPAAAGECAFCHRGHESEHRALLTNSQPDLCLRCHDADLLKRAYHQEADKQVCSACHDPHFAGNRMLLADSRTYRRGRISKATVRSTHAPWKDRKCSACHIVDKSYQLVEDMDAACLSCHQKALSAAKKGKHHAPVRQGKCSLCHEPHQSSRLHLVRPAGETICYTCHKPQEISGGNHPRVSRVDCLLCHRGHHSQREHLLKPGIPSGRTEQPATLEARR